jgi:alkyl hydroperoxide reductase subunit AhpC
MAIASRVWSTAADLPDYHKRMQVQYPVALDASGKVFQLFGVREAPTVIIVDADGIIRHRFDGFSPELTAALAADR